MAAARGNRTGLAFKGSCAHGNGCSDSSESLQNATRASLLPLLRPGLLEEQRVLRKLCPVARCAVLKRPRPCRKRAVPWRLLVSKIPFCKPLHPARNAVAPRAQRPIRPGLSPPIASI